MKFNCHAITVWWFRKLLGDLFLQLWKYRGRTQINIRQDWFGLIPLNDWDVLPYISCFFWVYDQFPIEWNRYVLAIGPYITSFVADVGWCLWFPWEGMSDKSEIDWLFHIKRNNIQEGPLFQQWWGMVLA